MSLPRIKKRQSLKFWRYLKQSKKFLKRFLSLLHFALSGYLNLATKVSQVVHKQLGKKGVKLHRLSRFLFTTFTAFIFTIFFSGITAWFTAPAYAAANLTITPITWNILGLDSNNVNTGPNVFMVGARVCNTGADPATNVVVKFRKDGVNSYINLQNSDTVTIPTLPSGSTSATQTRPPTFYGSTPNNCSDAYYNIVVTRTSAAYDTKLPYRIEAVADNAGMVSTPLNHELYVEKLVSQNRNAVKSITGPTTVVVGQTYQYTVAGSTATGGYEQLVFSPDFPNTLFQVLAVSATYTSPTGARNNSIYADACGWTNDPTSKYYHNNLACDNPAIPDGYTGAKAGNDVTTIYTVKILSAGSASITNLIYDFSGSSYHYNSDFGSGINAITITAVNPPDLTLTKSHTGNFTRGLNGTYTLVAKNSGSSATTGTVTVSDTLPTGLTPTAASGSGWTCSISGQTVTCTRSDALAAGGSYPVINLTVAVVASVPDSVTNIATVAGGGQTNTTNDSASDPTTIIGGSDLTVAKSHTGNFTQGQTGAIYVLTATNSGTSPTNGTVTLTDTLPAGLTATGATGTGWTCSISGQTVTCTRSDALAASSSYPPVTLTVNVAANAASSLTNTVTISGGGETNTANNSASDATIINGVPDLTITKTHTGNFTQGLPGSYTITATNSGTAATTGAITISDTVPTGLTPTSASGTGWTCSISGQTVTCTRSNTLAAGTSYPAITLNVAVASNAPTSVINTVTIVGGGETNTSNNSANDATTINGVPDLTITKTHTGNFTQSSTGSYTITATNSGTAATTGLVTVTDTLPIGLTASSVSGTGWTCSVSGQTVTCTRSDALAAGASYPTITLNVSVAANAPSSITNTAAVSGGGESITNNNTAIDPTGVNPAATTTISGTLYRDSDGGDDFDSGEPTLPANITVKLLDSTGATTIATTTTNTNGQYTFSGVVNGTYRIQVDTTDTDIPAGFTLGTPNNLSVTVSGSTIAGQNFGFDAPVANSCSIGGGTPDGAIAPYISAEVRSDASTSRNVVDTLDDNWRTAANAPLSGTVQPWFGTVSSPGTVTSFTYRDPSTAANISTTVELVDVAISGADACAGQTSTSTAQLQGSNPLQDLAPRPTSLYNSANQPMFWNQTSAETNSKRAAVKFTFAQPVKSFGAWFGDLETRTVGATPAILRLLDASGNRIGSDIVIQPTDVYENSTTATPVDQSLCGSAPGTDKGCGNNATRWIGFVDSSTAARVKQVLVIVGDDDQGDNGDTERISFIGANVIPSSPNVLLVKRITAVNGSTTTNAGDNLANYINEAANPYDDNTIEPSLAPKPPAYPTPDTDKWLNPSTFLVGGINGGAVQPNDTLEYTIYFLSTGSQPAKSVRFCDRVPENVTFVGTAFGSSPERGIVVNQGGTITNLTNVPDTDAGQYFAPGVDPATIYPGINCGGANTNGAVVVNLGDLPFATGQGAPSQSYGFIRFRGVVK
jgi:uncharacterized repeat protein (TIGR01451 family)